MLKNRESHFHESPDSRAIFSETWFQIAKVIGKPEKIGKSILDNIWETGEDITDQSLGLATLNKGEIFFDEGLNFFYSKVCYYRNHHLQELKMSVRIAKNNVSFDPQNKYYQGQLKLAEDKLEEELNKPTNNLVLS